MDIATSLKKFLADHLPKNMGACKNTLLNYHDTLKL
jgi:hypothetical protein